jgi:hypothetical protein
VKINDLKQSIRNYKKAILKTAKREKIINQYKDYLICIGFNEISVNENFSDNFLYCAGLKFFKERDYLKSEKNNLFYKEYILQEKN